MTPEEALTTGFQTWLDATVTSERGNVTPAPFDPYGSSMRYGWQLVEGMLHARQGAVTTSDPAQRFGDLKSHGLVSGSHNHAALTTLGEQVVEEWGALGLLDPLQEPSFDFPRNVVLSKAVLASGAQGYEAMLATWRELRADRPAADWFGDPWGVTAASYFYVERVGYNPYRVMNAAGCPVWTAKADLQSWAAAMPLPDPSWTKSRLGVVLSRIDSYSSRATTKIRFYQSLEAVILHNEGKTPADLKTTFASWGL